MQLEYHILWFDDQAATIRPFVERIQSMIARLGFEPRIDLRIISADVEEPLADLPNHAVDLVLMDWKLGGSHDGAKLARRVRQLFQHTDIVFYSSEPALTLRKLIFDQGIDGVFCVNRQNLSDRTSGIVQGQLRRVLDLTHMRGVVMAATSDLDLGMIDCLEVVQQVLHPGENKTAFAASISARVSAALRSKATEIDGLGRKGKLEKLLREPSFGALLRLQVLQEEVSKLVDRVAEPHRIERLGQYHDEVITPRNDFAHRKAELKEGQLVLEGRDKAIDQSAMQALRLRLLDHSDDLRGLLSMLRELAMAAGEGTLAKEIAAVEIVIGEVVVAIEPIPQLDPDAQAPGNAG